MQDAFVHLDRYMKGEVWVLGDQTRASSTSAGLDQDLRANFQKDYIQQWRDFLNAATVLRSSAYQEEAKKLAILSGNRSPLLMLLCEVSQNTTVSSPEVTKAFLPAQQTVPAPCQNRVVQPPNESYVRALNAVQTCLDQIQPGLPNDQRDAALNMCNTLLGQARAAADQIAQTFAIDQEGKVDVTVKRLLEAPTTAAPPPPPPPPAGAAQFCDKLRNVANKYPFNPAAAQEASLAELAELFQLREGALSKVLDQNKGAIDLQGSQYVAKGKPGLTAVINRAVNIQRALYPDNSPQMQYQFTLRAHPQPEISTEVITIEGQALKVAGNEQGSKTFTWAGNGAEASLSINGVSYGQFSGPWAAFHLFDNYTWTSAPAGFHLVWQVRGFGGQAATINGKPLVAQFDLESGNVPLFERGYLSALKCPAHEP
jgi:type VI protein secretion system component VasK